jgi:hypothetical protein
MNLDTAHVFLYAIAATATVVWLVALQFLWNTTHRAATPAGFMEEDDDGLGAPGDAMVRGSSEVAGQPAELSAKAAAHLAQHGAATLGPVRILDQSPNRVAFEALPNMGGRFVRHGVLEFQALDSERTRIDYAVTIPRRNGLLIAAWIVQMLGLVVLIIGFVVIHEWVASHPNPSIRWQSLQMLQVSHFLWPPFLLAGLYRRVQTHVRNTFDTLVSNVPYLQG